MVNPVRIRAKLDNETDVLKEMKKLYRQARNNQLSSGDCHNLISALVIIGNQITKAG